MAKHLVFMLHGMGQHKAGEWHKPAVEVLKTVYQDDDYPNLKQIPFDDTFEFFPITYSEVFEKLRNDWKNAPGALKSALNEKPIPDDASKKAAVEKQIDDISGWIKAGDSFFWTHAMDVILYRFFSVVREPTKTKVGTAMATELKTNGSKYGSWSILAHSLGTAVAHNTVNALYGPNPAGGPPILNVGETRALTIFMVANVSRVLQLPGEEARDPATTRVRPGSAQSGAACEFYLNARHKLDPFVIPKPFDVDIWPDAFNASHDRYQHLQCGHILQKNVHDLSHYLRSPAVHVPFFNSVLGEGWISKDEQKRAQHQFDSETLQGEVDAIRQRLEKDLPSSTDDWKALVSSVKKLKTFIDS